MVKLYHIIVINDVKKTKFLRPRRKEQDQDHRKLTKALGGFFKVSERHCWSAQ